MTAEELDPQLPEADVELVPAQVTAVLAAPHEKHCFVVMPFGRSPEERRWFQGWYATVIEPAVRSANYEPVLSATEQRPNAINDEIRAHLAFDPMVVVDLGGVTADVDPNPNVMYELGIRHALDMPLVLLAWEGQRLPFDINNQRVVMEQRDMMSIEVNRAKLLAFIQAAELGHYYRPMQAVGRVAALDVAAETLGRRSLLGKLVDEVRQMRHLIGQAPKATATPKPAKSVTIKEAIGMANRRRKIHARFIADGGTEAQWALLMKATVSGPDVVRLRSGPYDDINNYLLDRAGAKIEPAPPKSGA